MPLLASGRWTIAFAAALVTVTGCGAAAEPSAPPAAPVDEPPAGPAAPATPAAPDDHGSVSTKYPAFAPNIAQLINKGGRVLSKPVIVTITWADDPNVAALENVTDTIGSSSYWREVVGEYGVGPATSGAENHVHVSTPLAVPSGMNADPVQPVVDVISAALADPVASGWPAPTDQTVYIAFIHGAAAMRLCQSGAGGLHDSVKVGDREVPFAISAACSDPGMFNALESATISASHELAEAAVDPFPEVGPAWQGLSEDHLGWELLQMGQDENGDMCEFYDDAYGKHGMPDLAFTVQRSWSNKSAAAGHAPCVPAPKEPNFNVSPLAPPDDVVADLSNYRDVLPPFNPRSKGYLVKVGETRKIPLGLYSDGPTAPFSVEAFESDPLDGMTDPFGPATKPLLTLSVDKASGQNGEKAYLSVKVEQDNVAKVRLVVVRSKLNGVIRYMPILIGTQGRAAAAGTMSAPAASSTQVARRAPRRTPRVSTSFPSAASAGRRVRGLGRR